MQGQGLPLAPDTQIQVLHIVQEALSNVRKHARTTQVWLDVQQQPHWRFEVRDNGIGFDADDPARGESHVGLRIMAERAERIGARLEVISSRARGCSVVLDLAPAPALPAPAVAEASSLSAAPSPAGFIPFHCTTAGRSATPPMPARRSVVRPSCSPT